MVNLPRDITEYIEDFGHPSKSEKFNELELSLVPEFFTDDLRLFLAYFGRSIFEGGRLQTCHANDFQGALSIIFGDDNEFSYKNCLAYAYSSMREIYCWHQQYGFTIIDILYGTVVCRLLTKNESRSTNTDRTYITPFGAEADAYDDSGHPLFARVSKKLGPLEIGECYGFFPALALGGTATLGNLKRVNAPEHFAIVAQTMQFSLIDVQGYGKPAEIRPIGTR